MGAKAAGSESISLTYGDELAACVHLYITSDLMSRSHKSAQLDRPLGMYERRALTLDSDAVLVVCRCISHAHSGEECQR